MNNGPVNSSPLISDPESLLRRLEWTVLRRLDGVLQGDYRSLFRGFGLDLADLREYQPQDDVRHIDWNVTARMEAPYVREFQEDREVAAWFVVDLSSSIDFGSQLVRKRGLAIELVGVLARLLTRYGNRVGAILVSDHDAIAIPARAGRRHILHVLDCMLKAGHMLEPKRPHLVHPAPKKAPGKLTDLSDLITRAQTVIKRRCVVFLISDFISTPGWGTHLAHLAQRHETIAVRLFDPLEIALPDMGLVSMQDSETGEQIFVDTHDAGLRKRFAKAAALREELLRKTLGEAGVDCLELATDDRLDEALLRFTRLRKQRSQLAAGAGTLTLA
jgi:uncharacterized protein (DUF58 family)